jgi:hypothetical protein
MFNPGTFLSLAQIHQPLTRLYCQSAALQNERDNLANDCQGKENNYRSDEVETIDGSGLAVHRAPPPVSALTAAFSDDERTDKRPAEQ